MKQRLKTILFRLLGKDPEAVVVSFLTGQEPAAAAMLEEVRGLLPERRHYAVRLGPGPEMPGVTLIALEPGPAWRLSTRLRRQFRRYRIGMAPVLFTPEGQFSALRRAAFLLTPTRILAYNSALERHHLRWRTGIASWLFLRGVPLDRIFLRPRWLCPWKKDRSEQPSSYRILEGRPLAPPRRRVAVLSPYFPYPLSHGGAVRIFHLLREAAKQFDVFLFAFTESAETEHEPVLEFCARAILVSKPLYREPRWSTLAPPEVGEYRCPLMQELLARFRREFQIELLQVEYTCLASAGTGFSLSTLVAHDVTFDLYRQIYERQRTLAAWCNWWRWRHFETRAARRYQRVIAMSEKDAGLLGGANLEVIANGVDLERFRPEEETPGRRLLFVGSFRHFPNVAAYRFLAGEVWPVVRRRLPEATLTVVGGPAPLLYWRSHTGLPEPPAVEGVRLLGFVRDVRPLYAEANLVVVPTVVSAGTNLKVLEAMALERAVVSTSCGCAGLGLEHAVSVWIADRAEEFAEGVLRLLRDDELRRRLAQAARRHAESRYDWRELGCRQRALWSELLPERIQIRPAGQQDLAGIGRIQEASPEAVAWDPARYLSCQCRVAVCGGRLAGFIVTRQVAQGEREILNLAVDPAWRRQGIGASLLEHALAGEPATWFLEVRESNTAARTLYGKLGFVEVSRRPNYYQDTAEAAVVMRLQSC